MTLKNKVQIECLKNGITMSDVAREIGISRHNYYFHLKKENESILKKTENILGLKKGYFTDQLQK